jgi:DNA-binding response OmpR family regulator
MSHDRRWASRLHGTAQVRPGYASFPGGDWVPFTRHATMSTPHLQENTGNRTTGGEARLTILLAEDDMALRSWLAELLRKEGHRVIEVRDGADLMADLSCAYLAGSEATDAPLLVTDLRLPVNDSLSIIRAMRGLGRRPHFILMTAFGDAETHAEAARLGAIAVLDKPFEFDDLRSAVVRFSRERRYPSPGGGSSNLRQRRGP